MGGLLLLAAGIFVLFKTWHGWRLGVVRQVVNLFAALIGCVAGIFVSKVAGSLLGNLVPLPERALGPIGGVLAGTIVYLALMILGAILFKRTKDQRVLLVRLLFGFGGAVLGALYALFIVAVFAIGLRLVGTLAETKLAMEKTPYLSAANPDARDELTTALAELKRAADRSPITAMLKRFDPIPDSTYTTLTKLGKVAGNSRAIERLFVSPELRPVMEHPKVAAILREPGLNQLLIERRYAALTSNPRVVAAIDDPEVVARLRAVDWPRALDRALRGPDGK